MRALRTHTLYDLPAGNYMCVYLINARSFYQPNFNYPVTKNADNAGVRTHAQLKAILVTITPKSHHQTTFPQK